MLKYYLRVDAVNLNQFVYDTHDISTIRGGSYILLEEIEKLRKSFEGRLQAVSTAASQGLFSFECPEEDEGFPERFKREILTSLHEKTGGHATFVAAVEKGDQKFSDILEKLEAQIHRQQWRMPTVAIPEFESTDQECYLDGWRPGVKDYRVNPEAPGRKMISASTAYRRDRGRNIKQELIKKYLNRAKYNDQICVKDLNLLAKDEGRGILDGKIAYIQTDGNSFTKLRRKFCISPETRSAFDNVIQGDFMDNFLRSLVLYADSDPGFKTHDAEGNEALRMEILVRGGDEMTLVVPAWKGLEVMELFFQQAASHSKFNKNLLTHKAALIFCHHNTPILQVRTIAEELLPKAKTDIEEDLRELCEVDPAYQGLAPAGRRNLTKYMCDPHGNACHYLALESLDMLGGSLEKYIGQYYKGASYCHLLLRGEEMEALLAAMKTLKGELAYGQVLKLIELLREGKSEAFNKQEEHMLNLMPKKEKGAVEGAIQTMVGRHTERWYLLADLWNYVTEG